jgi:hypothetical protein
MPLFAVLAATTFAGACSDPMQDSSGPSGNGAHSGITGGASASGGASSAASGGEAHGAAGSSTTTGGAPTEPHPCGIEAPTSCPDPAPTYSDVEPIFTTRCVVCHSGVANGPWPLTTYGHIATWRDTIRAALLSCAMPPADASVSLDETESSLILRWIRCGMPT